eukprot:502971-Pyramimonas_sp.AAC.1
MNHGPTEHHEESVGHKTTFRILNRKWTQLYTSKDVAGQPVFKVSAPHIANRRLTLLAWTLLAPIVV